MQGSALLLRWGSWRWARNLWGLIIYLFFLPVMLPCVIPRLAIDLAVRVFPGVWKLLSFLRLPSGASPVAQRLKHLPGIQEIWVWSLGREDSLEKEMATHSSTLAWRIQWREEPGRPRKESSDFIPTSFSLFMSFIFFPTSFRRQWTAFLSAWCPLPAFRSCFVQLTQFSNVLLMNLCDKKWSPHAIPPPS